MVPNSRIIRANIGVDLVLRRNIGLVRIGVGAGFFDFLDHGIGGILALDIVHHDIGPGCAQGDRDPFADSGIGAGHQRLLAAQKACGRQPAARSIGLGKLRSNS